MSAWTATDLARRYDPPLRIEIPIGRQGIAFDHLETRFLGRRLVPAAAPDLEHARCHDDLHDDPVERGHDRDQLIRIAEEVVEGARKALQRTRRMHGKDHLALEDLRRQVDHYCWLGERVISQTRAMAKSW
jgi:hypothetical protein